MDLEVTTGPYEEEDMCDDSEWTYNSSVIPVLYVLIFILSVCGNGAVVLTVWRAQGKRSAQSVFIGNLALSDLVFALSLPFWAAAAAKGYWPFGAALCKISSYVVQLNMYASAFFLTCMSLRRYVSIARHLSPDKLRTRGHVRSCLIAIWILSGLLAAPLLVFHTTTSNEMYCVIDFSLVASSVEQERQWFVGLSVMGTALGFVLPFLVMTVCYCFIGFTVARHFNILREEGQREKRLLKIVSAVVLAFAVCWMPFHVAETVYVLYYVDLIPSSCSLWKFLILGHPFVISLRFVNSCLNPFLYVFFDTRVRSQVLNRFCCKKISPAGPALAAQRR